jgi:hypothetical protein
MDWRNFFSIISGWMDGWLSFSPSIWMDDFSLHHLGWMFSSAAVRSLFSLSLSLLPLLSRLCVAVHCSDFIFCNVFDASLPKICHCLLLFVAVFFFHPPPPHPLSFLFVRQFSFVSVLEQPSLEAFLSVFGAEWRKNHKSLCCCKGTTATTTRRRREKVNKNKENKENNVHCPFFVSCVRGAAVVQEQTC